jgi:hypothetical protein
MAQPVPTLWIYFTAKPAGLGPQTVCRRAAHTLKWLQKGLCFFGIVLVIFFRENAERRGASRENNNNSYQCFAIRTPTKISTMIVGNIATVTFMIFVRELLGRP